MINLCLSLKILQKNLIVIFWMKIINFNIIVNSIIPIGENVKIENGKVMIEDEFLK